LDTPERSWTEAEFRSPVMARLQGDQANQNMPRRIHPLVVGGSVAGVLDIIAALALSGALGTPPQVVLQSIASGLLGRAAFAGGLMTAALGVLLHFVIAFTAAAVYYAASRWWPVLVRRPVRSGAAYGVVVYVVMNAVVLPLSRVAPSAPRWSSAIALILIHMVCVGLPIALAVARADDGLTRRPAARARQPVRK
jgi:uncharacterized membrane protein YagU involved in acid resistance